MQQAQQFGKMAGLVLNSKVVLRLNFCAKLNICAWISATSPSCKTMWQNPLRSFGYAESGILPHRFGGLHPQMLLVATRTSHICEFAKSQERKQTSFSGLRKSAEPTLPNIIKKGQRIIKINKFSIFEKH